MMENSILNETPSDGVCKYCGNKRKPPAKTGRPRRYCNALCRSVANSEVKRVLACIWGRKSNLAQVRTDPKMAHFTDVELEWAELERLKLELAYLVSD